MDSLRDLLGVRIMGRVSNVQIRGMCGVTKEVDERIGQSVLRWFGHIERMGDDRITKRVYVEQCMSSRLVSRPLKRWTDSVNEYLNKIV